MGNHIRNSTQSRLKVESFIERKANKDINNGKSKGNGISPSTVTNNLKAIRNNKSSYTYLGVEYSNFFSSVGDYKIMDGDVMSIETKRTHKRYINRLKNRYPNINGETMNRLTGRYNHVLFIEFTTMGRAPIAHVSNTPVATNLLDGLTNVDINGSYNGSKFTSLYELRTWILLHNK